MGPDTRQQIRSGSAVWRAINDSFDDAVTSRMNLLDAAARLTAPPFGLKDGIIPVLLIAALVARKDDIALYEHGSLVLAIDDAVAERLTKNPAHFAVRNTQAQSGVRKAVIDALVARFGISGGRERLTFLKVATALFRDLRLLPPYAQKTQAPTDTRDSRRTRCVPYRFGARCSHL